ncbi:hypothetical protein Hypma_008454 [Hypsizygus marmoreus]|uniref:EthD domain-containing protein n=1 Tax=Hypsizygus marmoreus TaxID=39966 RepID=A0A369JV62_HYPMA|nr:hypothetical protein Hypma_008454 [Hypsizygus marmoreus]
MKRRRNAYAPSAPHGCAATIAPSSGFRLVRCTLIRRYRALHDHFATTDSRAPQRCHSDIAAQASLDALGGEQYIRRARSNFKSPSPLFDSFLCHPPHPFSLLQPRTARRTSYIVHTMAAVPLRTDRARMLIFLKRKEGTTKAEFSDYWHNQHAPLFMSLDVVKKNILKYEQAHTNDTWVKTPEALGVQPMDWDGVVVMEAETHEKLFEIFQDPEYQRLIGPDELKFVDRPKCQVLPLDFATRIDL